MKGGTCARKFNNVIITYCIMSRNRRWLITANKCMYLFSQSLLVKESMRFKLFHPTSVLYLLHPTRPFRWQSQQATVSKIFWYFCAARCEPRYFICGAWLVVFVLNIIQMVFRVYTRLGHSSVITNSQPCIQGSENILLYFCSKVWYWTLQQLQYSWKLYSV